VATPLVAHWVARGSTVAITAAMLVTTPASEGRRSHEHQQEDHRQGPARRGRRAGRTGRPGLHHLQPGWRGWPAGITPTLIDWADRDREHRSASPPATGGFHDHPLWRDSKRGQNNSALLPTACPSAPVCPGSSDKETPSFRLFLRAVEVGQCAMHRSCLNPCLPTGLDERLISRSHFFQPISGIMSGRPELPCTAVDYAPMITPTLMNIPEFRKFSSSCPPSMYLSVRHFSCCI